MATFLFSVNLPGQHSPPMAPPGEGDMEAARTLQALLWSEQFGAQQDHSVGIVYIDSAWVPAFLPPDVALLDFCR